MTAPIEAAISRGIAFLLSKQDPAGSWTDWALPPGPSAEWTTAYVGYRLVHLPQALRPQLEAALARAADWLHRHRFPDGGWGYNPTVPADADSTAWAILFLSAATGSALVSERAALWRFQCPDGGFATYPPDGLAGSWGRSHPEVTASAVCALVAAPSQDRPRINRAVAWLGEAQHVDGTWNAFWWRTHLVAMERCLAAFRAAGAPRPVPAGLLDGVESTDNFELALLLSVLAAADRAPSIPSLVGRLLRAQATDGSWAAAPALRVTQRDCEEPWSSPDAGPLFADNRRLFTTATVVAALVATAARAGATEGENAQFRTRQLSCYSGSLGSIPGP